MSFWRKLKQLALLCGVALVVTVVLSALLDEDPGMLPDPDGLIVN